jgi:hypothetical protein
LDDNDIFHVVIRTSFAEAGSSEEVKIYEEQIAEKDRRFNIPEAVYIELNHDEREETDER